MMLLPEAREKLVWFGHRLVSDAFVTGPSGNLSLRDPKTGYVAITPSGILYHKLEPEDIVIVDVDQNVIDGKWKPSSETPMHTGIYRRRPEVRGIVHTHSRFATLLASLGMEIPPIHYLVPAIGDRVPVAPYATYGTEDMARVAAEAMGNGRAVLLDRHGVIAVGPSLEQAYVLAEIVEYAAELHYRSLPLGKIEPLPPEEIRVLQEKFGAYGQKREE